MRGSPPSCRRLGEGKDACSIQTLLPDNGQGLSMLAVGRAVQELMDGKQRRDELERLLCRVENENVTLLHCKKKKKKIQAQSASTLKSVLFLLCLGAFATLKSRK